MSERGGPKGKKKKKQQGANGVTQKGGGKSGQVTNGYGDFTHVTQGGRNKKKPTK